MARAARKAAYAGMGFELNPGQAKANTLMVGAQRHTLLKGGARSGKTFLFVRAVVVRAIKAGGSRHAMLRFRANAARASLALDTLPRVMRVCFPGIAVAEHRQEGYFELPNGSEIWVLGLDDKERVDKILGLEFATLFFNECSQIPYSSVVVARTRLAQVVGGLKQRAYYDLNPGGKSHWTNKEFVEHRDPISGRPLIDPENYGWANVHPEDNKANLSPEFLNSLRGMNEKQRKRFYEGEYVDEVDGALWSYELIEQQREEIEMLEDGSKPSPEVIVARYRVQQITVNVDPSGAAGKEDKRSDEIGITVTGLTEDGIGVVLEDITVRDGPAVWGSMAVQAFHRWGADRIVAEINFGGAMVTSTIKATDQNVPVKVVSATRGKWVRAEPVSALYVGKRIRHIGHFPELEDQLVNFSSAGYAGERSPDRADSLIWGFTDLMLTAQEGANLFEFYRRLALETEATKAPKVLSVENGGVRLFAPLGTTTVYLRDGSKVTVGQDRSVLVDADGAPALRQAGFRDSP